MLLVAEHASTKPTKLNFKLYFIEHDGLVSLSLDRNSGLSLGIHLFQLPTGATFAILH
jgi:hypothetical protein